MLRARRYRGRAVAALDRRVPSPMTMSEELDVIRVRGARQHNLRNLDLELPPVFSRGGHRPLRVR